MSIPALLDHVVIGGPDLEGVVSWFEERTGVRAAPGGSHPTGTANALIALTVAGRRGPRYLELIGPDPAQADHPGPLSFGVDRLSHPTVVTYAIHPENIGGVVQRAREAGYDPGDVRDLSRRTPDGTLLEWRLTRPQDTRRFDIPFLIDWGGTQNPGHSDIPTLDLVSFVREEPDPGALQRDTATLGLADGETAVILQGETPRYVLEVRTPEGQVVRI